MSDKHKHFPDEFVRIRKLFISISISAVMISSEVRFDHISLNYYTYILNYSPIWEPCHSGICVVNIMHPLPRA